jgi:hypothetical protein
MGNCLICTYHQILLADQIKENEVDGACGTHVRGEKCVQGFGGKARKKRPLERPKPRWEEGIKMDLWEIGWGEVWSEFT